jgi:hypothetical protein
LADDQFMIRRLCKIKQSSPSTLRVFTERKYYVYNGGLTSFLTNRLYSGSDSTT